MSQILESIFDNQKHYETIAARRSVYYPDEARSLELVKEFIIKKKRILYGGMAIDLNLKKSGHEGIYGKDVIPDYDFMSPDFYNDSNELAKILHDAGLPNVSAINAAHITSRRVRTNFIGVADMTYIPAEIYDKLPVVVYDKMRIIHPDFQRMDIHRAFSIPFSNPPLEVIQHRLYKDQKRFRLLNEQYPIEINKSVEKSFKVAGKKISVKKSLLEGALLTGMPGYALLMKFIKIIKPDFTDPLNTDVEFTKSDIVITLPDLAISKISILSDHPLDLLKQLKAWKCKNIKYYNRYLDNALPRKITLDLDGQAYELLDNKGELTPCYGLLKSLETMQISAKDTTLLNKIYISHPNYLLLYLLVNSFIDADKDTSLQPQKYIFANREVDVKQADIYRYLYSLVMSLVQTAETLRCEAPDYIYQPFFMPIETYGNYNWSFTYIHLVMERENKDLPDKPTLRPMFGYYPESANEWPDFDVKSSFLYRIDGAEVPAFDEIKLKNK